jgi:dienelactone hydrolase
MRLEGFDLQDMAFEGSAYPVYRAGTGPGVIVVHEVPGITSLVADFARRLVDRVFTVFMPSLFGTVGKPTTIPYAVSSMMRACVSREFHCLAIGQASPITSWLRALARRAHDELGGPGVGAIGMCLTSGFGLAMMVDESVAAPVLSQPANPLPLGKARQASLGLSEADLAAVQKRPTEGCQVLGLRFTSDSFVRRSRFEALRNLLGDSFIAVEIDSSKGNPYGIKRSAHSVLTEDLVDEPGHPTREALERVLSFFEERLTA